VGTGGRRIEQGGSRRGEERRKREMENQRESFSPLVFVASPSTRWSTRRKAIEAISPFRNLQRLLLLPLLLSISHLLLFNFEPPSVLPLELIRGTAAPHLLLETLKQDRPDLRGSLRSSISRETRRIRRKSRRRRFVFAILTSLFFVPFNVRNQL